MQLTHWFDIVRIMKTSDVIKALTALAQESRLATFRLLIQNGQQGLRAGKIAELLNIMPTTLSFHLKELSNASLVNSRQEGRFVIYMANFKRMNELLEFLTANCCTGNSCMSAMECVATGTEKPTKTA